MSSYDLSSLSPADGAAALRSYPRRYRAALRAVEDDESVEELARRYDDDGDCALDLASDTVRSWMIQAEALRQIDHGSNPVVHPGVVDATQRHWETSTEQSLAEVLDQLEDQALAFADQADRIRGAAWTRTATLADAGTVTALDVLRAAVRTGRDNLDGAEKALAAARRR
jgi:transposase-like protein